VSAAQWAVDELRALVAGADDVVFLSEDGVELDPPLALADLIPHRPTRLWDGKLARIRVRDRGAVLQAFNRARIDPGTVTEVGLCVNTGVGTEWVHLYARYVNLVAHPAVGAVVRTARVVEHRGERDEPEEPVPAVSVRVPWARMDLDAHGAIVAVHGTPEALYGASAEEMTGTSSFNWIHPDDLDLIPDVSLRARRQPGTEVTYRTRINRADGSATPAIIGTTRHPTLDRWHLHVRDAAHEMRRELTEAMARDQLVLEYQPVVDIGSGRMVGAEALVRWRHPDRGLVPPGDFIPLAEMTDSIVEVGAWVLQRACAEAAQWPADLRLSVNLSVRQLADRAIVDTVARALTAAGLPAQRLTLEVTESALMDNAERALTHLGLLRELGVRLAIDDFGTGYSSMQYLKRMPVDVLKIDRAYVSGLGRDEGDTAIVTSVVALAHAFRLRVIAEGIETEDQHRRLVALGCDAGQGFLFSRPVAPEALRRLMDGRLLDAR
jgi:PAS domain S-box-containing protein